MKSQLQKIRYAMYIHQPDDRHPKIKIKWSSGAISYRSLDSQKSKNLWNTIIKVFIRVPIDNLLITTNDLTNRDTDAFQSRAITSTIIYVNPIYVLSIHSTRPNTLNQNLKECAFRPVYIPHSYIIVGLDDTANLIYANAVKLDCEYICTNRASDVLLKDFSNSLITFNNLPD